jgi:hypothetical protein
MKKLYFRIALATLLGGAIVFNFGFERTNFSMANASEDVICSGNGDGCYNGVWWAFKLEKRSKDTEEDQ